MDINKEIQAATDKVVLEKLPKMVEEKVSKMLEDVIKDIFSSYGNVSKEVKSKIEEKLDVNLQQFDLIDYNYMVSKAINDNITQQVNLQPILDLTKNAIGFIEKKEITINEVADIVKEVAMAAESEECSGEITFEIEESDSGGYITLYADIEPRTNHCDSMIELLISIRNGAVGSIFSFKSKNWKDNKLKEMTPSKMVNMNTLEAKIFRLYSAQVKITNCDVYVDNEWYRENMY